MLLGGANGALSYPAEDSEAPEPYIIPSPYPTIKRLPSSIVNNQYDGKVNAISIGAGFLAGLKYDEITVRANTDCYCWDAFIFLNGNRAMNADGSNSHAFAKKTLWEWYVTLGKTPPF